MTSTRSHPTTALQRAHMSAAERFARLEFHTLLTRASIAGQLIAGVARTNGTVLARCAQRVARVQLGAAIVDAFAFVVDERATRATVALVAAHEVHALGIRWTHAALVTLVNVYKHKKPKLLDTR